MTDQAPSEAGWIADFDGLPLAEVMALGQLQGRIVRLVRPGDVVTLDWQLDRLTVQLDENGALAGVRPG